MASGRTGPDRYVITTAADPASPYAALAPGARAATDEGTLIDDAPRALAALPVSLAAPPHPWLEVLQRLAMPGVIMPTVRHVAHGIDWILCPRPDGPSLGTDGPLDEHTLLNRVLHPAAAILLRLSAERVTHRAIRPGNLFATPDGVQFGPFWLAPPAFHQPAIYETPGAASCVRQARGNGTAADDVYALGVTLLTLFLGEAPMAGVADQEVIDRKLWLGSYTALTEGRRIPSALGEVIAAMVADQSSHRPTAERLLRASVFSGPASSSRKRVNAAIPMMLAGREVWNAPQLAHFVGDDPQAVGRALELGQVDAWLRRGLNEVVLAERVELAVHPGGLRGSAAGNAAGTDWDDRAALLGQIAHLLDPECPIVWQGLRLMPDGLGGLLAAAGNDPAVPEGKVTALLGSDLLLTRAAQDAGPKREAAITTARNARSAARQPASLLRLLYELNPGMACGSPLLARQPAAMLSDLLPALETAAATSASNGPVIDLHVLGFIAARRNPAEIRTIRAGDPHGELRLMASICSDTRPGKLPALSRRLAGTILTELETWPGASRREARRKAVESAIASGDLPGLLVLANNRDLLVAHSLLQSDAHAKIVELTETRDGLADAGGEINDLARRFGREGVAVVGVAACAVALLLQLLA